MSAIAARKARLALQVEAQALSNPPALDQAGPSSAVSSPKRKALAAKVARPTKISRQKQSRQEPSYAQSRGPSGVAEESVDEYEEDDDSSNESDTLTDVEEKTNTILNRSFTIPAQPACSTYSPIKEGKRKNWCVARQQKHSGSNGATSDDTSIILGLTPGQTLLFVGKAQLKVLDGCCSISGAQMTPQHRSVSIFAPQNHPLPIIQARSGLPTCKALSEYGLSEALYSAILEIKSITGSDVDDMSLACPQVRSGCFTIPGSSAPVTGFHPIFQPTRGLISSFLPASWGKALSSLPRNKSPLLYMIKGPKRVGKSTFSRYLLNRLVSTSTSSVAYLETDLGQAEFGPPGMVALHLFGSLYADADGSSELIIGPSWTSLRHPLRSHFLGDTTPRDDPSAYIDSIVDLYRLYCEEVKVKGVPLIINTQGWVKGLGADLLASLERLLQPTHIFDMVQYEDDGVLQEETSLSAQPHVGPMIQRLEAAPLNLTRDRGLNAVEVRTMNLVSYFYSKRLPGPLPRRDEEPQWNFSVPLVQQRPYIVDVQQGLQGGIFVLSKGASVDRKLHLMALNGSIVALVSSSHSGSVSISEDMPIHTIWNRALSQEIPSLRSSNFLSLAVVRSIDIDNGHLHLITPLSSEQLQSGHSPTNNLYLVKGAIEVPIWLSLNYALIEASQSNQTTSQSSLQLEGAPLSDVPYLDFATEYGPGKDRIIGQEKRKVRRNILRRSQRGGFE